MVWRYGEIIATFQRNLTLIHLMVSEKTCFTDRRTMDARATVLSFADTVKQS